jgi:hypothetical protein
MAVFFGVLIISALTLGASLGVLFYLDKDAGGLNR